MRDEPTQHDLTRSSVDDAALEVFLTEILGGGRPVDQTDIILQRLQNEPADSLAENRLGMGVDGAARSKKRRAFSVAILGIAALAAATLLLVSVRDLNDQDPNSEVAGVTGEPEQNSSANPAAMDDTLRNDLANSTAVDPSYPLDLPASTTDLANANEPNDLVPFANTKESPLTPEQSFRYTAELLTQAKVLPPVADREPVIRKQLGEHFLAAWKQVDVQPTALATSDEVASRLESLLSIEIDPTKEINATTVQAQLKTEAARDAISQLLLEQLLGRDWKPLDKTERETLQQFVSDALNEDAGFDVIVTQLFASAPEKSTAPWIWQKSLRGDSGLELTQQVAHSLLDVDAGCARCHDHPLDSKLQQSDYWAFASVLQRGVAKDPTSPKDLFYELADGRQRYAEPAIPAAWLGLVPENQTDLKLTELRAVSSYWKNNPRLAQSLVNRLWSAVYGRPLTGAVSDPDAPPSEQEFTQIRDYLASQTRAYDFNISKLVSWIVTAPPMHQSQALDARSQEGIWASNVELANAESKERVFAAFPAATESLPLEGLVDLAMQWNGGNNINAVPATLAQPIATEYTKPYVRRKPDVSLEDWLRTTFPTSHETSATIPAQWLHSIDSYDEQALHLFYAAGYWTPSKQQREAAENLRASSDDPAVALRQLWWTLRNAR